MLKTLQTLVAVAGIAVPSIALGDEIIVTTKGQQSLASVLHTSHLLTQSDIEAAQVKDISALLNQISGISTRDSGGRGSQTSVFLRGVSNSQTIVLIDGVRVGSATLGAAALNSYPIEAIERIEVVKGPFSGIYGADAIGGVIQLFTKKGGRGPGTATATVGSDSLNEYGISLHNGNDKNSFHISAHSERTNGIDRTSIMTEGNDDTDGYQEAAVSFGSKLTVSDSTTAKLSILSTDSRVEFDNTFGADPGLITENKTLSTALSISSELGHNLTWNTTVGLNEDQAMTNGTLPSKFVTNRDSLGTELVFWLGENSLLTTGVDYYQENIESSNDFPTTDRDNHGVYAQIQTGTHAIRFVGSLRYDDNSAYGSISNGSLALNYDLNDNLRAVASYGTAFVAPSFNYLYFPSFGNPNIQPEESDNIELSLLGKISNLNWRVSTYQTDITNLFSFDPDTFLAANIGEAEIKGVEFEINTQIADWLLSINADMMSARNKKSGLELDDRAEQTLAMSVARSFGNLNLRFDFKSENGRFDNSGTALASYSLFDISAQYQINDHFSVLTNISNLFDKNYITNLIGNNDHYNTEGRQAKLTLKYDF